MKESQKDLLLVLGYFFLQNGKAQKAAVIYRALNELEPEDPHVMKALGYALISIGAYEEGYQVLETLFRSAPEEAGNEIGVLLRSRSLWGLNRQQEAREFLNRYLRSRESADEARSQ